VSLDGEPGRDDGGLPPVNVEIPDDARELERDVLAYHREIRARRRRQRVRYTLRPFLNPSTAVPLIAIFAALSLIAGVLLSALTITPASAPTRPTATASAHAHSTSTPRAARTGPSATPSP
jgi:hypothetical protein